MTILDMYKEMGLVAKSKTASECCGPCPCCGGRDRFTLFLGQGKDGLGRYWCRQCNISGDRIQFLRDVRSMGFREACRELSVDPTVNCSTPKSLPRPPGQPKEAWKPRSVTIHLLMFGKKKP